MNVARNTITVGDAEATLRQMPDAAVDMVLTSPPYFRLRDYQSPDQIGLEPTVDAWVSSLRGVAREAARILVPTGSLWLNLGDTYATQLTQGAQRKSLLLGPERLAAQLVADGWRLRNKVIWHKTNHMPTSVADRFASAWEIIYVFVRQDRYYFDLDGSRVPHTSRPPRQRQQRRPGAERAAWLGPNADNPTGLNALKAAGLLGHPLGKNPGDVWRLAASNFRGAHHATFPVALAERAILAGCPEARCATCRQPWQRLVLRDGATAKRGALGPTCTCARNPEPGLVLDPFFGAGTTAVAAERLGRDWLGVELNADFAALADRRIRTGREVAA